jgi:hypothetical protein
MGMNMTSSIFEQLQKTIAIGQDSPELRLPPVPDGWKIKLVLDEWITFILCLEKDHFVLRWSSEDDKDMTATQIQVDVATLQAILDDTLTPTKAWSEGYLNIKGLAVGHFTDPSISILFQLLRCGLGRRLPTR